MTDENQTGDLGQDIDAAALAAKQVAEAAQISDLDGLTNKVVELSSRLAAVEHDVGSLASKVEAAAPSELAAIVAHFKQHFPALFPQAQVKAGE